MLEIVVRNSARCLSCGDEIVSSSGHDFRYCRCGDIAVDGGLNYTRRVYKTEARWIDTSILAEQPAGKDALIEAVKLLASVKAGFRPTPDLWVDAPLLVDWKVVPARMPPAQPGMQELEGIVSGHPEFRGGERIRSAPLLFTPASSSWARTMTRYWRLGTPAKEMLN